ncbi:TPA: hypothetical protein HMS95_10850 [Escherichia coli]|nr:hypothetical protein [Escherichia coli]EFB5743720.1 hypothetical protein [Escherichia coli]EFB6586029.1 hypothetical protein [Escherichia coli]EFB9289421.1 hypothetical protein [Escherichia coli]EFC6917881.1 hypothetical protein [Escherichia coli]
MHYPYRDNATVQYRAFPKRSPHHSNPTRHSIFDHEERQIISVNVSLLQITTVFYISLASGPRMLPFDVIFLTRFFFMV